MLYVPPQAKTLPSHIHQFMMFGPTIMIRYYTRTNGKDSQSLISSDLDPSQDSFTRMETLGEYKRPIDQNGSCLQIGINTTNKEQTGKLNGMLLTQS